MKTKKLILNTVIFAASTASVIGLAEIERTLWKTHYLFGVIGAILSVVFLPLFALDVVPGCSLDTPWFFVPAMIPILVFWAWIAVFIEEWLRKSKSNYGDVPDQ
jgi:hypothetical protein